LVRKRTTVPTRPADARVRRSVEALHTALLELIEIRPLDQILLREITDRAGLSYPTFFRRFASKEELLIDIARNEVRKLMEMSAQAILRRNSQGAQAMCEFIQMRRKLWETLLTGGAASAMRDEFLFASREMSKVTTYPRHELPVELMIGLFANGTFEVVAWWMRQGYDYPVANVIKLFNVMITDPLVRLRRLKIS